MSFLGWVPVVGMFCLVASKTWSGFGVLFFLFVCFCNVHRLMAFFEEEKSC